MKPARLVGITLAVVIAGAVVIWKSPAPNEHPWPRTPSPSGTCVAYVARWERDYVQVMLAFEGGCSAGAVTAWAPKPPLRLTWLDPATLEVEHPAGVSMERNAQGEYVQCGGPERRVRVVLKAVER